MNDAGGRDSPSLSWSEDDVRACLRAYGRSPASLIVQQLPSWWFNLVLRVEADGERLVLRRYGVTPPEEVRWELAVLGQLRQHNFPAIAPLFRADVPDDQLADFLRRPAVLYPFVEGERGCEIEWSIALAETARAIARLHVLTEGLAVPYPRVWSGTESRRIIREFLNVALTRGVAPHEWALRALVEEAERALVEFEALLAPDADAMPRGVVHHDAHCENVLFRGDRLVALIDFDDAYEGYLVADVAVMITNWAKTRGAVHSLDLNSAVTVVREYERHRQLTVAERELLPHFALLYLLCNAAQYIRGRLESGMGANTAVSDCTEYKRYLNLVDNTELLAAFRKALAPD